MKDQELVKCWEESGLLVNIPEEKKVQYSKNLEKARKAMLKRNKSDRVETLIFPLVRRMSDIDPKFNVTKAARDFIKDLKSEEETLL